jgi:hypothetical protein
MRKYLSVEDWICVSGWWIERIFGLFAGAVHWLSIGVLSEGFLGQIPSMLE